MFLILKITYRIEEKIWSQKTYLGPLRFGANYFIIGIQAHLPLGTSKCLILQLFEVCPFFTQ